MHVYIQTEYTWYTTPKYQFWFRAILGRFKKKIPNETWTHPPTYIVNSDFWHFYFAKPLYYIFLFIYFMYFFFFLYAQLVVFMHGRPSVLYQKVHNGNKFVDESF